MKIPLLLAVVTTLTGTLAAQEPHGGKPCPAASGLGFAGRFDCMRVPVLENRELGEGREIELHVVVLPATGDDVAPDPVFFLPGGPGQSGTGLAGALSSLLGSIREERDIVLVDYRGTGDSNPLDFEMSREDVLGTLADPFPVELLRRERARLQEKADLTQYTTDAIVDDLDDVREFLGYDKINLWGASYGTRVALVFLRRHGEHVRSAVIKAVAPLGFAIGADFATDAQKSLDRTIAACAADPECAQAYGDVGAQLERLMERLREEPVTIEATSPLDGKKVEVPLSSDAIAATIRMMLYSTPEHAQLPRMIARGAEGELQEWADKVLQTAVQSWEMLCEGLFLSVAGAEDGPILRRLDLEERTRGTFLRTGFTSAILAAFDEWPCAAVAPSFYEPVRSDVPVLVVSGELDPVTPPNQGAEAARHLSNGLHLVFPNGSHDDSAFKPCIDQIYADFFHRGSLEGLDTSCAGALRPRRFAIER